MLHNNAEIKEIEVYGLPLGLTVEATYDEVTVSLTPGDTVFLYTDGITEVMNASRELFGDAGLTALLQREGSHAAPELLERTWSATDAFGGDNGQADDMTVMVLKALR